MDVHGLLQMGTLRQWMTSPPVLLTVGHRDPLSPLLPPFCVFISTLLALYILRLLDIPPLTSPRLCRAGTVGTRPKSYK